MKHPISILIQQLKDVEDVQERCLKCGNQTESDLIEETKTIPLKIAIRLLYMFSNDDVKKMKKLLDNE